MREARRGHARRLESRVGYEPPMRRGVHDGFHAILSGCSGRGFARTNCRQPKSHWLISACGRARRSAAGGAFANRHSRGASPWRRLRARARHARSRVHEPPASRRRGYDHNDRCEMGATSQTSPSAAPRPRLAHATRSARRKRPMPTRRHASRSYRRRHDRERRVSPARARRRRSTPRRPAP